MVVVPDSRNVSAAVVSQVASQLWVPESLCLLWAEAFLMRGMLVGVRSHRVKKGNYGLFKFRGWEVEMPLGIAGGFAWRVLRSF